MPGAPIHIHAAEQIKEVEDCLAWSKQRPVEWLLDEMRRSIARWCLVHCTHMTDAETARLAHSGAVAGLCPTTEANLGDGLFPAARLSRRGRALRHRHAIHNVATSPVEELRWLEYGAAPGARGRATSPRRRPGDSDRRQSAVARALAGGAQAAGAADRRDCARASAPISSCSTPTIRR